MTIQPQPPVFTQVLTLCSFTGTNGRQPYTGLVQGADGNFYGNEIFEGGSGFEGNVFKMTQSGSLTTLVTFTGNNGAYPRGGLLTGTDGNFYGTTCEGGTNGYYGTVFKMTPSGTLTTLYSFSGSNGSGEYPNPDLHRGTTGGILLHDAAGRSLRRQLRQWCSRSRQAAR